MTDFLTDSFQAGNSQENCTLCRFGRVIDDSLSCRMVSNTDHAYVEKVDIMKGRKCEHFVSEEKRYCCDCVFMKYSDLDGGTCHHADNSYTCTDYVYLLDVDEYREACRLFRSSL